jgi:Glycosyl-4,4'-diaponeurosporenoate acyltransferase
LNQRFPVLLDLPGLALQQTPAAEALSGIIMPVARLPSPLSLDIRLLNPADGWIVLEVQVPGSHSDLALAARRNAANTWVQAVVWVAIAVFWFWLSPMALFWYAVWNDGRSFSMIGCAVGMTVSLLALLLPAGYYQPRPFEQSGRIYERLGVRWFKRWSPVGVYVVWHIRHFLPDYKVISGRGGLSGFNVRTRTSEQGHLLWMLVTVQAMLYALWCGWAVLAGWLFLGNLIINVYPIMAQRYNRARIQRILDRGSRTGQTDAAMGGNRSEQAAAEGQTSD